MGWRQNFRGKLAVDGFLPGMGFGVEGFLERTRNEPK
jgi:hypothetical protein